MSPRASTPMPPSNFETVRLTHGILMGIAFVIFMPLGGIAMRTMSFKGLVWIHAGWMMFAYIIALAAMGLGIWAAVQINYLGTYHAIIGLVVIGCLLLQPITGLVHHLIWRKKQARNVATYPHLWWGRAVITLAMINGGLGLQLVQAYQPGTKKGIIVYSVIAGVIWLVWMGVIVMDFFSRRKPDNGSRKSSVTSDGEKAIEAGTHTEVQ